MKKLVLKLLCWGLVVGISIYTFVVGAKAARRFEIYNQPTAETQLITIYHVETFEGGIKPRINYLKTIARTLEKENAGVLFNVQAVAPDKLESALNENVPDIISFGFGVGKLVLNKLSAFKTDHSVRGELKAAGEFNGEIYALPYIVSGYALFSHGGAENEVEYGCLGYTNPTKALSGRTLKQFGEPFETYKNFVYHQDHGLLGTARDVFRVDNLNKVGRTNASITPLNTYTDLLQFVGKTRDSKMIDEFINRMFSAEKQATLAGFGLFSALENKIYDDGIYNDMENAILQCEIANVFA